MNIKPITNTDLISALGTSGVIASIFGAITAFAAHVIPLTDPNISPAWPRLFGALTATLPLIPLGMLLHQWRLYNQHVRGKLEGKQTKRPAPTRAAVQMILKRDDKTQRIDFESKLNINVWSCLSDFIRANGIGKLSRDGLRDFAAERNVTVSGRVWTTLKNELKAAKIVREGESRLSKVDPETARLIVEFADKITAQTLSAAAPPLSGMSRQIVRPQGKNGTGRDGTKTVTSGKRQWGGLLRKYAPTAVIAVLVVAVVLLTMRPTTTTANNSATVMQTMNTELAAALPKSWSCEPTENGAYCRAAGTWEMPIVLAADGCTALISYTVENGILQSDGKRKRTTPLVETINVCE